MRILWISHVIPYPPKSGVHLRSYNLLRGVARNSVVDLFSFIQEPWLEIFYKSRREGLDDCRLQLQEICHSVRFIEIDGLLRPLGKFRTALEGLIGSQCYTVRWLQSARAWEALRSLSKESSYDLVHFDTVSLAPFRSLFGDTPATLGHHNVESHMLSRRSENERNWLKRQYFLRESRRVRDYEIRVASRFAAHILCSDLDRDRLLEVAPEANAVVIPNGVDVEYFCPVPTDRVGMTRSIIFVGSLNWYPNVDAVYFLLNEIWPQLKARVPDLVLDIVGSAPPGSILRLAASLDGVRVHGFVNDVRPLMGAATIYICPIRDGGGTKLKLLDAFAMGKCVVAHPIACEGIEVEPGSDVILAESASEFVQSIQSLLNDPVMRQDIGSAARKRVEEGYTFSRIAARLRDTFAALIENSSASERLTASN